MHFLPGGGKNQLPSPALSAALLCKQLYQIQTNNVPAEVLVREEGMLSLAVMPHKLCECQSGQHVLLRQVNSAASEPKWLSS